MTSLEPAGWYPDPAGGSGLRYWDGSQWTEHTHFADPAPPAAQDGPAVGGPGPGYGGQPSYGAQPPYGGGWQPPAWGPAETPSGGAAQPGVGLGRANRFSLIGIGVSVLYLALAVTAHFVILGIIPLGMAVRARRGGERLAPLAIAAAVVSLVVGLGGFFR